MNNTIIACQIFQDELNTALQQTGCLYPVIWVDSKYHIDPNELSLKLQKEIDNLKNIDNILLAYGCCGNSLVGLKASTANLIIPKTDDCISLFLSHPREKFKRRERTYFLTKGWMDSSNSIANEYWYALKRYGERRTQKLFDWMLKEYKYLMFIDTGVYNNENCIQKVKELAQHINLELIVAKGDTWLLNKLLMGPYDEDFCVVPKGGLVNTEHFGYKFRESSYQAI